MVARRMLALGASLLALWPASAAASYTPSYARSEKKSPALALVVAGGPMFATTTSHEWASECPDVTTTDYDWSPSCSASRPIGLVVDVRLEVLWGVLGFDLFVLGAGDWTEADLAELPPVPLPDYAFGMQITRLGAGGGGGIRFKTKPPSLQLSVGAGGGIMLRQVYSNVTSLDGDAVRYAAPIVRADIGAVAGAFTMGILGWVEVFDRVTVRPDLGPIGLQDTGLSAALEEVALFQGPEFFVGPFVGVHLGG